MSSNYKVLGNSIEIHSTAIVHPKAKIGAGSVIGPYSIIGPNVVLGERNILYSHVVIEGNTIIGNSNEFFSFCVVGSKPQVVAWKEGKNQLIIGDNNIIREHVTIQPGLDQFGGVTSIGNENLFMISSHIGHDCIIGNYNRFTNYVGISGHVVVGNHAIVGGFSGVHQFVMLGDYSFIGAGSIVTSDIPPFCMAEGNRATLIQINSTGLARNNFDNEDIRILSTIFRELFFEDGLFAEKLKLFKVRYQDSKNAQVLFDFIEKSKRGIAKYVKRAEKQLY